MTPVPTHYRTVRTNTAEAIPAESIPTMPTTPPAIVGVYTLCIVLIVAGLVAFKRIVKGSNGFGK